MNRREMIRLGALSAPAIALSALPSISASRPNLLDRFIDPLPRPKRIDPYRIEHGVARYRIRMIEVRQRLHSKLPPTKLWGYEGQYPGPVIEARRGSPIEVEWINALPRVHLFPIDPEIHGATPPVPQVRAVPHLHGSATDSISDGLPERWFPSGRSEVYRYPNNQRASTLWYHDHALGITRLNVYAGLSGFYLLRDEEEDRLNLPSGEYEVPIVLQDRTVDDRGELVYSSSADDGTILPPGIWGPQFFGELPVLNGAIFPYLEVEPRPYRLRLLNGANSRFFHLFLNLAKHSTDVPSLVTFHQIGSDGGLLSGPIAMQKLLLGPAERADLVVDFSAFAGKTITLSNDAFSPYPGWGVMQAMHEPLSELLQIRVVLPLSKRNAPFTIKIPAPVPRLDPLNSVVTRDFVLHDCKDLLPSTLESAGKALCISLKRPGMLINLKGYNAPVSEFPRLHTIEKWRFLNTTDDAHPMHLHLVQFQVLERQGFDLASLSQGQVKLIGVARPFTPGESGWKDTAVVNPREMLSILVPFEGYTGKYVFHCHMLEHEDNDMMRPFVVVGSE